jgi:hypothetical protein
LSDRILIAANPCVALFVLTVAPDFEIRIALQCGRPVSTRRGALPKVGATGETKKAAQRLFGIRRRA